MIVFVFQEMGLYGIRTVMGSGESQCVYIIGPKQRIVTQVRKGEKVQEGNHQSKEAIQKYILCFSRGDLKLISEYKMHRKGAFGTVVYVAWKKKGNF